MTDSFTIFSSPLGELLVAGTEDAATFISHDADAFLKAHPCLAQAEAGSIVSNASNAIRNYLRGVITMMRIPYAAEGTAFQKTVWSELSKIPYGQTATYSEIAERIGKPASFRAVANACGKNPVPLLIPCHRALHKSTTSSGFTWGVEVKKLLLELETSHSEAMAA